MIGHYLLTLNPVQETRVLTRVMRPGSYAQLTATGPCLVGAACGHTHGHGSHDPYPKYPVGKYEMDGTVETRYDRLCSRFSVQRINNAIRNRILSNIARRTLVQAPVPV